MCRYEMYRWEISRMSNPLSNERKDWCFHPLYPQKPLVPLSFLLSLSLYSPIRLSFRLILFFF